MCNHPDCPNPEKAKHLMSREEATAYSLFVDETPELKVEYDALPDPKPVYGAWQKDYTDVMPDLFHAKPMRIWLAKKHKIRVAPSMTPEEITGRKTELQAEYDSLPDPKPPLYRWLAMKTEGERFWRSYITVMTAPMLGEQTKANALISEYGTARPKQEIELTGSDLSKEDNLALLRKVLELNGIDPNMADALKDMGGKKSS
jgi:hypothetical protein